MLKKTLNKIADILSYYTAFFILDKFLNIEKVFKEIVLNKNKNILFLIMSGHSSKDRVDYISKYFHANDIDHIFYSDYNDPLKNVLKVTNSSTYSSNELKHVNILNFIISQKSFLSNYKWVYLFDDDTFVNVNLLQKLVGRSFFSTTKIHGQLLTPKNNTDNPFFLKYPQSNYLSGGAGYLCPVNLLQTKRFFKNYKTTYADNSFGLNFNLNQFEDCNLFHSQKPNFYNIDDKNISEYISFHYIKSEEVYKTYIEFCK